MNEIINPLTILATEINTEHNAFLEAMQAGLQHALKCGNLLLEAKAMVPHGEWLPWLADNCQVSERSAQAYMRVAQHWPELSKSATVADLTYREALQLLAENKPSEVLSELILQAEQVSDYYEQLEQKVNQAETPEEVEELSKKVNVSLRTRKRRPGNKPKAR